MPNFTEAFPAGTSRQLIELDAVTLSSVSLGVGDPPLVLVHGYTGSALDWADVIGPLAAHRRVIAYDHRGHGDSGHAGGGESAYTFEALVTDLESAVDTLGLDTFHLLGHSMGGVVSMRYALANSGRLASLVLMDTAAATQGMPLDIIEGLTTIGRSDGIDAMAQLILAAAPPMSDLQRERGLDKLRSLDLDAFVAFGRELGSYPSMLTQLGKLALPTTVICGVDDPLTAPCEDLAATIPGATLELIADAGHSPQEDQPEAWLAAVARHFARLPISSK